MSEDDQTFTVYSVGLPNLDSNTKILGVNWNKDSYTLFFESKQISEFAKSLPPTKRSLFKVATKYTIRWAVLVCSQLI